MRKETVYFNHILSRIVEKSVFQKKKLEKFLTKMDDQFFNDAEAFATKYSAYLESQGISLDSAVDSYLKMVNSMFKYQVKFIKTGAYPEATLEKTYTDVYANKNEMLSYMVALAISQFMWPTHYAIYRFFSQVIRAKSKTIATYLEIGPGHGLFLNKTLEVLNAAAQIDVVDISPVSIDIARSIVAYFQPRLTSIQYHTIDMLKFETIKQYDFITMGEVLEHVTAPQQLLLKLKSLLKQNGSAFISTCVNCPAVDHLYQFCTIEDIQSMLTQCGFTIQQQLILPVEELPMAEIITQKITINYCALITL